MPFSPDLQASMLNWSLASAPVTRPQPPLRMALCTGSPSFTDIKECQDPGYARQVISYPPSVVQDGTAQAANDAEIIWGPFSNGQVVYAAAVIDANELIVGFEFLQAVLVIFPAQTTSMGSGVWPSFLA
jgi:hypothetical protein